MNLSGSASIDLNFWTAVMLLVPLVRSVEPILKICAVKFLDIFAS